MLLTFAVRARLSRFQLATACGEAELCCEMRVSAAVTRMTPGHTLRQKGNTAREKELFNPSAAN